MVKLYNTLTRTKETVKTGKDRVVKLYTCGLTVYSQPHIGNWVSYIYWDVLVRLLKQHGFEVNRVQNITDVGHLVSDDDDGEDKMQTGAKKEGMTAWDVAEKYISIAEHEAYELLGLMRPDEMPRATNYIDQQINFVRELEQAGYTYLIHDDGIYFDTSKLDDYGKLAQLDVAGLKPGARIENQHKRNVTDFAVWKFSPKDQKRDMEWDSPWGPGFPGWHLECSVMARELLGDQIDIHTGGVDHIAVHHSNEIAQTEAITKKPFSKLWLHNNHLKVDGSKMAKSVGNIYTLDDIQSRGYSNDAFKLLVLSSHYRTEGNFSWEILESANNRLVSLQQSADMQFQPKNIDPWMDASQWRLTIMSALDDDLNTPQVLSTLSELAQQCGDRLLSEEDIFELKAVLQFIDDVLGLSLTQRSDLSSEQLQLLEKRSVARKNKDFSASDDLRNDLLASGVAVRDTTHGQIWSRV